MRVVRVTPQNEREFGEKVRALEAGAIYPLGADRFRLNHGPDYFAFFRRLGELRTYVGLIDGRVVCIGSGVLRRVRLADHRMVKAWYLCDLKVDPEFRGLRLPAQLFGQVFLLNYLRCRSAFAVTMNRGDSALNGVVRILAQFPWIPLRSAGELAFYVWSESEVLQVAPLLDAAIGPWRLRSLAGIKDLVLQSTGQPWSLYHIEGRECLNDVVNGPPVERPVPGAAHMLCVPRGGRLDQRLKAEGCRNTASATIVAHRLDDADWRFLASSEI